MPPSGGFSVIIMNDFIKQKSIHIEPYPFEIVFCLLSEEGITKLNEGEKAKCVKEDFTIYIFLGDYSIPTIVHELFHATEFIMSTIGQNLSKPPNETWAYLLEDLTEEIMIFLEED